MAGQGIQPELNAALDRLWLQYLPQIEERVGLLEGAGKALMGHRLPDDQREAAKTAAHKLAGVLGTFGLMKGTILAREAEMLCAGDADPESAERLNEIGVQLRALIAARA